MQMVQSCSMNEWVGVIRMDSVTRRRSGSGSEMFQCGELSSSISSPSPYLIRFDQSLRHVCRNDAVLTPITKPNTSPPPTTPTQSAPSQASAAAFHAEQPAAPHRLPYPTSTAPIPLATSFQTPDTNTWVKSAARPYPLIVNGEQTLCTRTALASNEMDRHRLDLPRPQRDSLVRLPDRDARARGPDAC